MLALHEKHDDAVRKKPPCTPVEIVPYSFFIPVNDGPRKFTADHPFLYFISSSTVDLKTIIFQGKVRKP
ncbi:hypothetical protein M8J75_009846 [Diaphorina citri]|nr:hypothetical protein M8J75_009846 [Diaphorina citri]